jgi:hypothetical protein
MVARQDLLEAWHGAARPLVPPAPIGSKRSFSGGGQFAKLGDPVVNQPSTRDASSAPLTRHRIEAGT